MRFRKKPVIIDAKRWFPDNHHCIEFATDKNWKIDCEMNLLIETLEGTMKARPGDWIIRGVKGEYYPCKPDIFEATYEEEEV